MLAMRVLKTSAAATVAALSVACAGDSSTGTTGPSLVPSSCTGINLGPRPSSLSLGQTSPASLSILGAGAEADRYTGEIAVRGTLAYTTTWQVRKAQGNKVDIWDVSGNTPQLVDSVIVSGAITTGDVAVSDDGKPVVSAHLMRTALEYAQAFDIPVIDHCEEPTLARGGSMNEGMMSARLGLRGIPSEAEEIMVIRDILLARRTGGHVHLAHMSTAGSVELIRWGKERGINVTAEVTPHHLTLTEAAVGDYDTSAKMNPPLRTEADVEALREALRDGTIDLVATDHAPHHYDAKEREFADAPFGIVGLETALALVVTELVEAGIIDFPTLVDRMSTRPARLFHLDGGTLAEGSVADVTVFDPAREWVVDRARFLSKGRNTPYAGDRVRGRAVYTIVGGRVVFRLEE